MKRCFLSGVLWLLAAAAAADVRFDRFGGWADGPKLKAAGDFRAAADEMYPYRAAPEPALEEGERMEGNVYFADVKWSKRVWGGEKNALSRRHSPGEGRTFSGVLIWHTHWWSKARDDNGDGTFFYAGADGRPVDTVRAEAFRDGVEDYEYLAMLSRLCGTRREVPPEVSRSLTDFDRTGEALLSARARLAREIESRLKETPQ